MLEHVGIFDHSDERIHALVSGEEVCGPNRFDHIVYRFSYCILYIIYFSVLDCAINIAYYSGESNENPIF